MVANFLGRIQFADFREGAPQFVGEYMPYFHDMWFQHYSAPPLFSFYVLNWLTSYLRDIWICREVRLSGLSALLIWIHFIISYEITSKNAFILGKFKIMTARIASWKLWQTSWGNLDSCFVSGTPFDVAVKCTCKLRRQLWALLLS
jgi:hypothetical protein